MTRVGRYFLGLRRDTLPWIFIIFFLFIVAMAGVYVLRPALEPSTILQAGDGVFMTRVVAVASNQRDDPITADTLTQGQAVLFAYDYEKSSPTTVQKSATSVDLVWINNNKKVVYIVKNVSKETSLQFMPVEPARYILELTAGTVAQKTITIGSQVIFDEPRTGGF